MWWRQAVLLFFGWVMVGSFLARGPAARPLTLIISGLLFSTLTAWLLSRMSPTQAVAPPSDRSASAEGNIFAHPPAARRWIRLGLVIYPAGLVGVSLAFRANLVGFPLLLIGLIMWGFAFILTLYVVLRTPTEVRVAEAGLELRLALGRRISIPWEDIVSLEPRTRLGRGARLLAKSGFSFSLDSSLPGYASLIALIQAHLDARQQGRT